LPEGKTLLVAVDFEQSGSTVQGLLLQKTFKKLFDISGEVAVGHRHVFPMMLWIVFC
jgi:hypothetical protein